VASARQADDKLLDFTYDNENDEELQVWLSVVVQRLVDLFQRHGAVDDFVPLLLRETNLLAAFPDLSPVRLLDRAGQVVQLPCSGLLAMARSAARRQIERIKRYSTGRGRYSEHPAGGQPKVIGELRCVFPCDAPAATDSLASTSVHHCALKWLKRSCLKSLTKSCLSSVAFAVSPDSSTSFISVMKPVSKNDHSVRGPDKRQC
jgi:hypothetical protein